MSPQLLNFLLERLELVLVRAMQMKVENTAVSTSKGNKKKRKMERKLMLNMSEEKKRELWKKLKKEKRKKKRELKRGLVKEALAVAQELERQDREAFRVSLPPASSSSSSSSSAAAAAAAAAETPPAPLGVSTSLDVCDALQRSSELLLASQHLDSLPLLRERVREANAGLMGAQWSLLQEIRRRGGGA